MAAHSTQPGVRAQWNSNEKDGSGGRGGGGADQNCLPKVPGRNSV